MELANAGALAAEYALLLVPNGNHFMLIGMLSSGALINSASLGSSTSKSTKGLVQIRLGRLLDLLIAAFFPFLLSACNGYFKWGLLIIRIC